MTGPSIRSASEALPASRSMYLSRLRPSTESPIGFRNPITPTNFGVRDRSTGDRGAESSAPQFAHGSPAWWAR
jgi:hypothetical protein